jgi:hypothetical protein
LQSLKGALIQLKKSQGPSLLRTPENLFCYPPNAQEIPARYS